MIGHSAVEFVYPDDLQATRNEIRLARRGRGMRNFETRYVHKEGRAVTLTWSGTWSEPEQRYFFTGRDVTETKLSEERLKYLAHYDQLTGLPNRTSLYNDLGELTSSRTDSDRHLISIALFDLDGFKDINDTLGHLTGDKLLRDVANRMSKVVSSKSRFYRLGGDEFVLILRDCGDPREAAKVVNLILSELRDCFSIDGQNLFVRASAGIAISADNSSAEELLSNVDLALYDAKAAGGNVYRLFLPVLRAKAEARRHLEAELRMACSRSEFALYFQPQIRLDDGAVVGAEALLRWRHPERGILAPGAFMDVLAESTVALELGRWILQGACARAARWRTMGFPAIRVGVNLFPSQFRDGTLQIDVETALRNAGLPPECLELEITENIALSQDESTLPQLRALRGMGIGLAFDDFGTGYASLSHLARYPLTRIKVDRTFMQKITASSMPGDVAVVHSLIFMAHNLGLQVIAEGVETLDQLQFLQARKCEEAQGFLYSKPLSADDFDEFLRLTRTSSNHSERMPTARAG
jgi:diguanylate cyclase (GGDEF)-like protein